MCAETEFHVREDFHKDVIVVQDGHRYHDCQKYMSETKPEVFATPNSLLLLIFLPVGFGPESPFIANIYKWLDQLTLTRAGKKTEIIFSETHPYISEFELGSRCERFRDLYCVLKGIVGSLTKSNDTVFKAISEDKPTESKNTSISLESLMEETFWHETSVPHWYIRRAKTGPRNIYMTAMTRDDDGVWRHHHDSDCPCEKCDEKREENKKRQAEHHSADRMDPGMPSADPV